MFFKNVFLSNFLIFLFSIFFVFNFFFFNLFLYYYFIFFFCSIPLQVIVLPLSRIHLDHNRREVNWGLIVVERSGVAQGELYTVGIDMYKC